MNTPIYLRRKWPSFCAFCELLINLWDVKGHSGIIILLVQFVMQCLKLPCVFGFIFIRHIVLLISMVMSSFYIFKILTKIRNTHYAFWLPMYDVNVDNCCGAFCIFSLAEDSTILRLKIFESSLILLGWIFVDQASKDDVDFNHSFFL